MVFIFFEAHVCVTSLIMSQNYMFGRIKTLTDVSNYYNFVAMQQNYKQMNVFCG